MDHCRDSSIKIPRSFLSPFEKSTIIVTINLLDCFVSRSTEDKEREDIGKSSSSSSSSSVVVVVVIVIVVVEIVMVVEFAMMVSSRVVPVVLVVLVVEEVVEVVVEKRRCFREPRSTFNHLRSITSAEKTEHRLATGRESETMSAFNSSSLEDDTPEERICL
ncbi:hypothetical protein HZH66_003970 [Vespula vulgaris]|uniref:Uncharacterized protein n=1 Tax=Vespula vulgaris TaxID=7454 RepID=A0A834NEF4_VESVU|nr:hypothetical protein HZH66_003970 [Vespula vulgaris]